MNAVSHKDLSTQSIFRKQENEKKRQYNQRIIDVEHGTFTPLVLGTNGGMGKEGHIFLKQLADKLVNKQSEDYSTVIAWIRTKLSFEFIRSTVLCLRGSRRPWLNNTHLADDFGLLASEARMHIY